MYVTGSTDVVAITLLASLMKLMNKLDFIDYDTDMKWYDIRTKDETGEDIGLRVYALLLFRDSTIMIISSIF